MKEGVLDILIYLFENYMDDAEPCPQPDRALLKEELEHAGFEGADVSRALQWLDGLTESPDGESDRANARAIRVFSHLEQLRLDTDCRGFLMHLEQIGILSAGQRELVIDRLHGARCRRDRYREGEVGGADGAVQSARTGAGVCAHGRPRVRGTHRRHSLNHEASATACPCNHRGRLRGFIFFDGLQRSGSS